ncbi:MAG: hypothetical protein AAGA68_02685 [Pseudomonadota bacterium]
MSANADHHSSNKASPAVDIVVLTKTRDLLYKVLATCRHGYRVRHATSVNKAEQLIQSEPVGVLVTNAIPDSLPRLLPRLRTWNPNLTVIAVGRRGQGHDDALLRLQESGDIFRFLMEPVSQGQLSLFVDAAARIYHERMLGTVEQARNLRVDARESRRPAKGNRTALPFSLAAMIFLSSVSGFFLLGHERDGGSDVATATLRLDDDDRALNRALIAAERARDARRFVDPPGDNAHYYYRQVLAYRPNHRRAAQGINDLVNQMFAQAELALRDENFEEARAALGRARRIAPSHPRLGVIGSQVNTAEQSFLLAKALGAAQDARYEQARELIAAAAAARPGETTDVRDARAQIVTIREGNEEQIKLSSELFEAAMAKDHLLPPWEDNARDIFLQLVDLNAEPSLTGDYRARLQAQLELRIDDYIGAGQHEEAQRVLSDLVALADTTLAKVRADELQVALTRARYDDLEHQRLRDLALARLQDGQLLEPANDSALLYLEALTSLPDPPQDMRSLWKYFEEALIARATNAVAADNLHLAERLLDAADRLAADGRAMRSSQDTYGDGSVEATRKDRVARAAKGDDNER